MTPKLFGIVNITADSFSDGGKYLAPEAAIAHALALAGDGADVLDLGAAASNPEAEAVPPQEEIARLAPVIAALHGRGLAVSVDSFSPQTQLWALAQNAAYVNDIEGFAQPEIYPQLAASRAKLVVMHKVQERGKATRVEIPAGGIVDRIFPFFEARVAALTKAGIGRERLILDPGMGLFLSTEAQASAEALRAIPKLKARFGLPVLVSVSRKSFLRAFTGRKTAESGAGTLAAEIYAALQGADFIRTHDVRALADGLKVWRGLRG